MFVGDALDNYQIFRGKDHYQATYYAQMAKQQGANINVDEALNATNITGDELNRIGVMFHEGLAGVVQNCFEAKRWYDKAREKDNPAAFRNTAFLFHSGQGGVAKCHFIATKYLQLAIEKGFDAARKDLDDLLSWDDLSHEDLERIAEMYHKGRGISQDHRIAIDCYIKAGQKGSASAFSSLGSLYTEKQLYDLAAKCFFKARQMGDIAAHSLIQRLVSYANGAVLYGIGSMFHRGDNSGIAPNSSEAKYWYEQAQKKEYALAYRSIGVLHLIGEGGVGKCNVTAAKYFQQAFERGDDGAQEELRKLFEKEDLPYQDLEEIAKVFQEGNGIRCNPDIAKQWFEKAGERGSKTAFSSLGYLYELEGHFMVAAKYYSQAEQTGDQSGQYLFDLVRKQMTPDEWYKSGLENHKIENYKIALACFKQVVFNLSLLPSDQDSGCFLGLINKYKRTMHQNQVDGTLSGQLDFLLGLIHEFGLIVNQDLSRARAHYEQAGNKREHFKRIERKLIEYFITSGAGINSIDEKGRTAFHRAAQQKCFKLYVTLKYLGADVKIVDRDNKVPGSYILKKDEHKLHRLSQSLTSFLSKLAQPANEIIYSKMSLRKGTLELNPTIENLEKLCLIPTLTPLFQLAKIAVLGRHRLSNRREVIAHDGYESDDEVPVNESEQLSIIIDPEMRSVENLVHYGMNGVGGMQASGVVVGVNPNTLYVAGGGQSGQAFFGTLVHELCHFVTHEVFDNNFNPYEANDRKNRDRFTRISENMKAKKNELNPIFRTVFDSYSEEYQHSEFIVRVPQLIAEQTNEGDVCNLIPTELFSYYTEVFLPKVENHCRALIEKALGIGFSSPFVEKFARNRSYSFKRKSEAPQPFSKLQKSE